MKKTIIALQNNLRVYLCALIAHLFMSVFKIDNYLLRVCVRACVSNLPKFTCARCMCGGFLLTSPV